MTLHSLVNNMLFVDCSANERGKKKGEELDHKHGNLTSMTREIRKQKRHLLNGVTKGRKE